MLLLVLMFTCNHMISWTAPVHLVLPKVRACLSLKEQDCLHESDANCVHEQCGDLCVSSYLKHHGRICKGEFLHDLAVTVLHHGLVLTGTKGGQLFWSSSLPAALWLLLLLNHQALTLHASQEGGQSWRQFTPCWHRSSSALTHLQLWHFYWYH